MRTNYSKSLMQFCGFRKWLQHHNFRYKCRSAASSNTIYCEVFTTVGIKLVRFSDHPPNPLRYNWIPDYNILSRSDEKKVRKQLKLLKFDEGVL